MRDLSYSTILKLNNELQSKLSSDVYDIKVLSNIAVHQIKDICEYAFRTEGINADVTLGDYDNIVQDSLKYSKSKLVIVFWELCNIIDGLQYKAELLSNNQLNTIYEKTKTEIDLVLKNLNSTSLVLFNTFTSLSFSNTCLNKNSLEKLAYQLNQYLRDVKPDNVHLVDLSKVIALSGVENSFDYRFYYSSKALYAIEFFKCYTCFIKPLIMSASGKNKKAIIFDCDNTLWKGILGEDGFDNIEMSSKTKDGVIFEEIQGIALALQKQGILLGLCSKNNPEDVERVIESHPDMQLRDEHITINKSNWNDKVTNLLEIASELNIGLDSLVFVDDSSFEVNLIKQQLPDVTVIQVPERLYDYPGLLRQNAGLFYSLSFTAEDKQKAKLYKQNLQRQKAKKEFATIDDYLASLELKVLVHPDNKQIVQRISQMSQKTNQFNLTTRRYTESDIKKFIANSSVVIFPISVTDKFGDNGVTGLSIVNINGEHMHTADIDTFLMSCRIIGRNIEFAFMDYIIEHLKNSGVNRVTAQFIKSQKNEQVYDFFDKCSFRLVNSDSTMREYVLDVKDYRPKNLQYIEVINGG